MNIKFTTKEQIAFLEARGYKIYKGTEPLHFFGGDSIGTRSTNLVKIGRHEYKLHQAFDLVFEKEFKEKFGIKS